MALSVTLDEGLIVVFFFHYNKPASARSGAPVLSLHFGKKCHLVNNIVCGVPTYGHVNKRQPRFVMKGKAKSISIVEGIAHIR